MFSKRTNTSTPFDRVIPQANAGRGKEKNESSFMNRVIRPLAERIEAQPGAMTQGANLDEIRMRLMRGGFPGNLRASEFLARKIVLLVVMCLVGGLLGPFYTELLFGYSSAWVYLFGLLFGAYLGWKLPEIWLSSIIRKRQYEIQMFLPDMIDLVTVSVEAGLGLDASLQRVASRFANPLSEEVLRAMQEVRLGRGRIDALRDMARRVDVPDLSAWVTALVQAELLGVSIANVLRVQSERLREKRSQRAREAAQKAPVKMVFPLVFCIFPALGVVIMGPVIIRVLESGFGT